MQATAPAVRVSWALSVASREPYLGGVARVEDSVGPLADDEGVEVHKGHLQTHGWDSAGVRACQRDAITARDAITGAIICVTRARTWSTRPALVLPREKICSLVKTVSHQLNDIFQLGVIRWTGTTCEPAARSRALATSFTSGVTMVMLRAGSGAR